MGTKTTKQGYSPDYAVAPGETLLEKITDMGMTQAELALRLGRTQKHVSRLINGIEPITQATAIALERVTGIPAQFWNSRETLYRERLARIEDQKRLAAELKVLDDVPLRELIKRGQVVEKKDKTIQLQQVLAFFGVSSTKAIVRRLCTIYGSLIKRQPDAPRHLRAMPDAPPPGFAWVKWKRRPSTARITEKMFLHRRLVKSAV